MYWYKLVYAMSFMPHSLCIYDVAIPSEFPMVAVSESTIERGNADFILTINTSVFTVTSDNLVLSGGDGGPCVRGMDDPSPQSLRLTCPGLSDGMSYNLMVNLSNGDNCLMILICFDTPSATSPSMTSPPTNSSPGTVCCQFYLCT